MKHFIKVLFILFISVTLVSCACSPKHSSPRYAIDEDSLILSNLIEQYGTRLDSAYNQSDLQIEKGNWVLDVASEMDWQDLIKYIIELPDFEVCELDNLIEITNGRLEEARCDLPQS